ncbi:C-RFamide peptide precursor-like [Scleropages formosus]|uniref:C-RFamide peptide-like n=1 Tax=Scleropages formosus TaxID=113540 RepID=A0A0P7TT98_SCLFO|nr:C-RFamide peptide precursor-like [Scleropages formosus]
MAAVGGACPGVGECLALLLLAAGLVAVARGTTLGPELAGFHGAEDRGLVVDPYWYVDRGVRPIGRFGKRQSAAPSLLTSLETLLSLLGRRGPSPRRNPWLP